MNVWPIGCAAVALGYAPFAFATGPDRFASLRNTAATSECYDGNGPLTAGPVDNLINTIFSLFSYNISC